MLINTFNTITSHKEINNTIDKHVDKKLGDEVNIQLLNDTNKLFHKSDEILNIFSDESSFELFTTIANHQQQIVLSMLGYYPEQEIALMLQASIDSYASKVSYIYGWTVGGKVMFSSALEMMFNSMIEQELEGVGYEDMFQLAMLDALLHADEYGINDATLTKMGTLLEKSGSGGHNNWSYTPEGLGSLAESIWNILYKSQIPKNSLAYRAMSVIAGGTPSMNMPDKLKNQFKSKVYNDPNGGGWIKNDGEGNNFDPFLKMVLMSHLLEKYTLTEAQMNKLLKTKSLKEIDEIVFDASKGEYTDALNFIFLADDKWNGNSDPSKKLPSGVSIALDYDGTPDANYLKTLYKTLSGRELSEDELEEVNRIGDQVKMLQQTLKYWTQICADGQLSIARNI